MKRLALYCGVSVRREKSFPKWSIFGQEERARLLEVFESDKLYKNPLFLNNEYGLRRCPVSCPYYGREMDYSRVMCPNAELISSEACWILQYALLADERDMKDIAAAVWKIWECKEELADVRYTCGIR